MKRATLLAVIIAVAVVFTIKRTMVKPHPATQPRIQTVAPASSSQGKPILYLFHDPSDQDAGCRRIYGYADQAERDLAGKVEVRRPDVKQEKNLVDHYQVRVLPTILLVSPNGQVERFEGEDNPTAGRIEQALSRLKETEQ